METDKWVTGAGESGKSTVLKQMRLIYAQGFSKNEKEEWRCIIFNNILSAFRQVMEAMDEMGIEFDSNFDNVRTQDEANCIESIPGRLHYYKNAITDSLAIAEHSRPYLKRARPWTKRSYANGIPLSIQVIVDRPRRATSRQQGPRIRLT